MPPRFAQVFVDATDTLLRVRGSVGRLYSPVARRHGFVVDAAAVDAGFRPALQESPPPCFPGAPAGDLPRLEMEWWHDLVRRLFTSLGALQPGTPGERFEAFFAEVFALFRSAAAWELLPGARPALGALRAEGRRLGIISEMDGRLLDVLAELDLAALFDPIALSMRCGCSKRDGTIYRFALERARLSAARCVHVGDSVEWDVEAARRTGIAAVHFDPRNRGGAPPGVPVARAWSEVPPAIATLEREAP